MLAPESENRLLAGCWRPTAYPAACTRWRRQVHTQISRLDCDDDAIRQSVLPSANNLLSNPLRIRLAQRPFVRSDPDRAHFIALQDAEANAQLEWTIKARILKFRDRPLSLPNHTYAAHANIV